MTKCINQSRAEQPSAFDGNANADSGAFAL